MSEIINKLEDSELWFHMNQEEADLVREAINHIKDQEEEIKKYKEHKHWLKVAIDKLCGYIERN